MIFKLQTCLLFFCSMLMETHSQGPFVISDAPGTATYTEHRCSGAISNVVFHPAWPAWALPNIDITTPSFSGHPFIVFNHSTSLDANSTWDAQCKRELTYSLPESVTFSCDRVAYNQPIKLANPKDEYRPYFCDTNCHRISSTAIHIDENTANNTLFVLKSRICDEDVYQSQSNTDVAINGTLFDTSTAESQLKITLQRTLDYEQSHLHVLQLHFKDSANHSTLTLTVHVDDTDDMDPKFTSPQYECTITEGNYSSRESKCKVTANDQDFGLNATINYALRPDGVYPPTNVFSIENTTGTLIVNGMLDRENVSEYTIGVIGYQVNRSADRTCITKIHLTIADVDDNPPVITTDRTEVKLMENSETGTIVFQLSATDKDMGVNAAFDFILVAESHPGAFAVDKKSGTVTVNQTSLLDRETTLVFKLQAYAQSTHKSSFKSQVLNLTVTLMDENDNTPMFSQASYTQTIYKTKQVGQNVIQIQATDADDGPNKNVSYSITDLGIPFAIDEVSGWITVKTSMNQSFQYVYTFMVKAEDQAIKLADRRFNYTLVTIHVNDVNTHKPQLAPSLINASFSISEASEVGTIITLLNATDQDPGDRLQFFLIPDERDHFEVKGQFLVTNAQLDRETTASFNIKLEVSDTMHADTTTLHITVLDENDCQPEFGEKTYPFNVTEESKQLVIGIVKAHDHDTGNNAAVSYSIDPDSKWNTNFTIDSTNGSISARRPLDREALQDSNTMAFSVIATDHGQPPRTGRASVQVTVEDINDNGPQFEASTVFYTMNETTAPYTFHTAKAWDADATVINNEVIYGLQSGNSSRVHVYPNGSVSLLQTLDLSDCSNTDITFIVTAYNNQPYSDGADSDTQTVQIHIKDVNNKLPVFNKNTEPIVIETSERTSDQYFNDPVSRSVRLYANDSDCDPAYNTVQYWVEDSTYTFRYDPTDGYFYNQRHIIYDPPDNKTQYNITLFASNTRPMFNGGIKNVSKSIIINIQDLNNQSPKFDQDYYYCSVEENVDGDFNCAVKATDGDGSPKYKQFKYKIVTYNETFSILHNGTIRLNSPFNYEMMGNHSLAVVVEVFEETKTSNDKTYCTVTVEVMNVNDVPPVFKGTPYLFSVRENSNISKPIGARVYATDNDTDSATLTYSTDNNDFQLKNENLFHSIMFDYEVDAFPIIFNVTVTDGVHNVSEQVTINILPVNEYAPTFTHPKYQVNVTEHQEMRLTLHATDGDKGPDGNIAYSAEIPDEWQRNITMTPNGTLVVGQLDRDVMGAWNHIEFTVQAIDGGSPPRTGIATVTITVVGTNDNSPEYSDDNVTVTVKEGMKLNYISRATDNDVGSGSKIYYRLHEPSSTFQVDNESGIVTSVQRLWINEQNNGSYTINVEAFNKGNASGIDIATQHIKIVLQDINNHVPKFDQHMYQKSIPECTGPGTSVFRVNATDADTTVQYNTVRYWIDDTSVPFSVDYNTGDISVVRTIDYDPPSNNHSFQFTVYVTDLPTRTKTTNHTVSVEVRINITNCDDNGPTFTQEVYQCSLEENSSNLSGCQVAVTDLDPSVSPINYHSTNTNFTVSADGAVQVHANYDYEAMDPHRVTFNITATDGSNIVSCMVVVSITNINDNPPVFHGGPWNISKPENGTLPQVIVTNVYATDADGDMLQYTINLASTLTGFKLENRTLYAATQPLDFESVTSPIHIEVIASDRTFKVNETVLIHIIPVNEFPPVFDNQTYDWTVKENTNVTRNIKASDADKGKDGYITYSATIPTEWKNNITMTPDGTIVVGQLDRDVMGAWNHIEFTVQAIDGGSPPRTGIATVTITVEGTNDNSPQYSDDNVTVTVKEGTKLNYISKATDKDDVGSDSTVHYRLNYGHSTIFKVDNVSGIVSSIPELFIDAGNNGSYIISVEAFNKGSSPGPKGAQQITVVLQDINNNVPQFVRQPYSTSISECSRVGDPVLRVLAKDADPTKEYSTITYWIQDTYLPFQVDPRLGNITVYGSLDVDPPANTTDYTVTVYATDLDTLDPTGNHTVNTTVTVHVDDCNDSPPVFTQDIYRCRGRENTTESKYFRCMVTAIDNDLSSAFRNITYTSVDANFNVSSSGALHLVNPYDYETMMPPWRVTIKVNASDGSNSDSCTVVVSILNINDNPPVFHGGPWNISKSENGTRPQVLMTNIYAMDADGDTIQYHINDTKDFELRNGTLYASNPLDFESGKSPIHIMVFASDGNFTVNTTVAVNILPVNEFSPVFDNQTYDWTVEENSNTTYQVKATDLDTGDTAAITYRIEDPGLHGIVVYANGSVRIQDIDRESLGESNVIQFVVQATDNGTTSKTGSTVVRVHVTGVNDNPPYFIEEKATLVVYERHDCTNLYNASALDADIDEGHNVSYGLEKGGATFKIDSTAGTLSCKSPLSVNNANKGRVNLTIVAYNTDGGPAPQNASQSITVIIKAINKHVPKFLLTNYTSTVSECSRRGTNITRVTATDADTTVQYNTVQYWIENTSVPFTVDYHTGDISVARTIDFDPPSNSRMFHFKVYATDLSTRNTTGNHTTTADVRISVTNCNDNPPKFDQASFVCPLSETTTGEFDCTASASDIDNLQPVSYTISNGDTGTFAINNSTGVITCKTKLDYDAPNAKRQYNLTIVASDGNHTVFAVVIVHLMNIPDEPPMFGNTPYTFSVLENSTISVVGTVSVTDKDSDIVHLSLRNTRDFAVRPNGDVIYNGTSVLNYETTRWYNFTVVANDTVNTDTAIVVVEVQDKNDNAPTFTQPSYTMNTSELCKVNEEVFRVHANDSDGSAPNNKVTYSILDGNVNNSFLINSTTGAIITPCVNVFETSVKDLYNLVVKATDGGDPPLFDISVVNVHINDENNHRPEFVNAPYTATVTENKIQSVVQVFANDLDPSSRLNFTVTNSSQFYFNESILNVNNINAEDFPAGFVNVAIMVFDGKLNDTTEVTVSIIDVNDNSPTFSQYNTTQDINDTASVDQLVLKMEADDQDITNEGFTFILYDSAGDFYINRTSGEISLQRPLDYKRQSYYNMQVVVLDSGNPPKSSETHVMITVLETNRGPQFGQTSYLHALNENSLGSFTINATDTDEGQAGVITYNITHASNGTALHGLFILNSTTGILSSVVPPDYESLTNPNLTLTITATDHAQFPKTATATVTIQIIDVNEAPVLDINPKFIFKEINTTEGTFIARCNVSDVDRSERFRNFTLTIPSNSSFDVDSNGTVYVKTILSEPGNFTVAVTVTDAGNLSDTANITVIVSDVKGYRIQEHILENHASVVVELANVTRRNLTFKINSGIPDPGNFRIVANKSLVVDNNVDFENTPKHAFELDIRGYDVHNVLKEQISLHVIVDDENDVRPAFNTTSYNLSVDETDQIGTYVGRVTADDKDTVGNLTYHIISNSPKFSIDPVTGTISTNGTIDYESVGHLWNHTYIIQVVCNDGNQTSDPVSVIITVNDVNDVSPNFSNATYEFWLNETWPVGKIPSAIASVHATDPDTTDRGNLMYHVVPDNRYFGMDAVGNDGVFKLKKSLLIKNTMVQEEFNLTIAVTDAENHKDEAQVVFHILDVNNNKPVFVKHNYTFSVFEGTTMLQDNFSVKATDKDFGVNANLSYHLEVTNEESTMFSISTVDNMGYIHVVQALDREDPLLKKTNGTYSLRVVAKDHGVPALSGSTAVRIVVLDVNDCGPTFHNLPKNDTFDVQEDSEIGFYIGTISTTDCDVTPEFRTVDFSLSGTGSDHFKIEADGSDVNLFVDKTLSLKLASLYKLTITADDGNNTSHVTIQIHILDKNTYKPVFNRTNYVFNISENDGNTVMDDVTVGHVVAIDEDPGRNGNVTYTITSGNDDNKFNITTVYQKDVNIGEITTISTLDRDAPNPDHYVLIVMAEDNAKLLQRQGTCTVTVSLMDVNDNSPIFNDASGYHGEVEESSSNGTLVSVNPPIRATDIDSGENGTDGILYTLTSRDARTDGGFCIRPSSAEVYVCGAIDRERLSKYILEVTATDDLGHGRSTNTTLTISITDRNDVAPTFLNPHYHFNVPENVSVSTIIGVVNVTDPDMDGIADIVYNIKSGGRDQFYIKNGIIRVSGKLDREITPEYTLVVSASDHINENTTVVKVTVEDVNDNAPEFTLSPRTINVVEETGPSVIYNFSAFDNDQNNTNNSYVTFSLVNTPASASFFYISEDGQLRTMNAIDRETNEAFTLTIAIHDHGDPIMNNTAVVNIKVLDINDHSPAFCENRKCNITSMKAYVMEQSPGGSIIALPVATDPDFGENQTITYSFQTSKASRFFSIDSHTGLVKLAAQSIEINTLVHDNIVSANYTDYVEVNITVVATDHGPDRRNATLDLMVVVEELNDNAPRFDEPEYKFSVSENMPIGTAVGNCSASVPNATLSHITYSLRHVYGNKFDIDDITGSITTRSILDREHVDHYAVPIIARDGRTPEHTAFTVVEIAVTDENDNRPVFLYPNLSILIKENTKLVEPLNVSAYDHDTGKNAVIEYSLLVENSMSGQFYINSSTGLVTINGTLDHECCPFVILNITATDMGVAPQTSNTLVTIHVDDVNDNSPVFYGTIDVVNITETTTGELLSLFANDSDSGLNGNVIFSIIDDDGGPFSIDPFNGTLSIDGHLDFESKAEYRLLIEASDQGSPPRRNTSSLTIHVTDTYDFVPHFEKDVYEFDLNWNTSAGTEVADLNAPDGNVIYSLTGGDIGYFKINSSTGTMTVSKPFERYLKEAIVDVTATDKYNQSAVCKIIVHIQGHAVVFQQSEYAVGLSENINGSTLLLDLNATEEIQGHNVLYSIVKVEPNVENVFHISPAEGYITCQKLLDREVHVQYTLYVSAYSSSGRTKREIEAVSTTVRVVINVADENDNGPEFPPTQQRVFGVPRTAGPDFMVTKLQAEDPDAGDNGQVVYTGIGGNLTKFGVDSESGEVRTLVAISSLVMQNLTLKVEAADMLNRSMRTTLDLQIVVLDVDSQVQLTANISNTMFRERQAVILRNMSNILGVKIQLEKIEPHQDNSGKIDLKTTDMFFHGINTTTHAILSYEQMISLISKHERNMSELFGGTPFRVYTVKIDNHDPSAITVPQIALIALAIFIFFGAFVAILLAQYTWTRPINEKDRDLQIEELMRELGRNEIEMDNLGLTEIPESGAGSVNPVLVETDLNASGGGRGLSGSMKSKQVYESQEIHVNFGDEPQDPNLPDAVIPDDHEPAHSIVDSGVGNTSLHSSDHRLLEEADNVAAANADPGMDVKGNIQESNDGVMHVEGPMVADLDIVANGGLQVPDDGLSHDEGPVMTSSPRVSRDFETGIQITTPIIELNGDKRSSAESGDDNVSNTNAEGINIENTGNDKDKSDLSESKETSLINDEKTIHFEDVGETTDDELEPDTSTEAEDVSSHSLKQLSSDISKGTTLEDTTADRDTNVTGTPIVIDDDGKDEDEEEEDDYVHDEDAVTSF